MADAVRGGRYLWTHPRLWPWVLAPFVASGLILALVIWLVIRQLDPWIRELHALLPGWLGFVSSLLEAVLVLVLLAGGYILFVALAALVTGPFNEQLSDRIEAQLTGKPGPSTSFLGTVREILRSVVHSLRRVLVLIVTTLLFLFIGLLVPVIGPIVAALGGALAAARFAAYDAYDAVGSRRNWTYRAKMDYLRAHRGRALGLGAAVAMLLLVPVLNLLALSVGAAGATLAFLDEPAPAGTARPGDTPPARALSS